MKNALSALAVAAALTAATAPSAQAMETEINMLTGAVFFALKGLDIPTDNMTDLSLAQLAQIKGILSSDDSENEKKRRVEAIMAR